MIRDNFCCMLAAQLKMATDELDGSQAKRLKIDAVEHLRALPTIRDRCNQIYEVGSGGATHNHCMSEQHEFIIFLHLIGRQGRCAAPLHNTR